MNDIPDIILQAVARRNFWAYCLYWDREFFQRRPFLYQIAVELQRIADGEINSLSVSLPPRAGKSYITSLFAAWLIGCNPEGSVMRNSTTARLYNKFSYDIRSFIRDPRFKLIFPNVKLADDKQSLEGWNTTQAKQVSYFGAGVGGTIVGFGPTLAAITDDLYRGHEDAMSDTINDKTHRWYISSHLSRLESGCPQIDIGTRWTTMDVIGKNIEDGHYDSIITVPALTDKGVSFCEDVKTTEEYHKFRDRTDEYIWESEYQQEPIELKGLVFPKSKINFYEKEVPKEGINIFYADPADEGLDKYSTPIARIVDEKVFILDAIFNTYNVTENEPIILAMIKNNGIDRGWIETNAFGASHLRVIRKATPVTIRGVHNQKNKMLRILIESGYILKNFYFPKIHPSTDYTKFFAQLIRLLKTGTKNDDAADSLAGLCKMARRDFLKT